MKKAIGLMASLLAAGIVLAGDYTPVTKESPVISGAIDQDYTAVSVANSGSLTPTYPVTVLTGYGQVDNETNAVTVAAVASTQVGQTFRFIVSSTSSNLVKFTDSAPLYLSGDWIGDNNDVLELYAVATNILVEVGQVDN